MLFLTSHVGLFGAPRPTSSLETGLLDCPPYRTQRAVEAQHCFYMGTGGTTLGLRRHDVTGNAPRGLCGYLLAPIACAFFVLTIPLEDVAGGAAGDSFRKIKLGHF